MDVKPITVNINISVGAEERCRANWNVYSDQTGYFLVDDCNGLNIDQTLRHIRDTVLEAVILIRENDAR